MVAAIVLATRPRLRAPPPTLSVLGELNRISGELGSNIADLHIGGAITGALDNALPEAERAARAGADAAAPAVRSAVGAAAPVVGKAVLEPIRGGLQLDGVAPDRAARMASQMGEVGGFLGQKTLELGGEGVRRAAPVADELAKQAILKGQQGVREATPVIDRLLRTGEIDAATAERLRAAAEQSSRVAAQGVAAGLRGAASLLEPLPPAPPPVKIGGVALPSVPTSPQALQQTATRAVAPYALGGGVALFALGALRAVARPLEEALRNALALAVFVVGAQLTVEHWDEIYATYSLVVLGRFN